MIGFLSEIKRVVFFQNKKNSPQRSKRLESPFICKTLFFFFLNFAVLLSSFFFLLFFSPIPSFHPYVKRKRLTFQHIKRQPVPKSRIGQGKYFRYKSAISNQTPLK